MQHQKIERPTFNLTFEGEVYPIQVHMSKDPASSQPVASFTTIIEGQHRQFKAQHKLFPLDFQSKDVAYSMENIIKQEIVAELFCYMYATTMAQLVEDERLKEAYEAVMKENFLNGEN